MESVSGSSFRSIVALQPEEEVSGRPFTEPARTQMDLITIGHMVRRIGDVLTEHPEFPASLCPPHRAVINEEGHPHQIVISQAERLRTLTDLIVVGFFGHMRAGAENVTLAAVQQVDEELIADFPSFGGILSYSSMRLAGGNWGNVATFSDMAAMEQWNCSQRHFDAVRRLSAQHYDCIRLHVGQVVGGVAHGEVHLKRTKYFQFETAGVWRGLCDRSTTVSRCPMSAAPPPLPPA
jgi:hypothetical protein